MLLVKWYLFCNTHLRRVRTRTRTGMVAELYWSFDRLWDIFAWQLWIFAYQCDQSMSVANFATTIRIHLVGFLPSTSPALLQQIIAFASTTKKQRLSEDIVWYVDIVVLLWRSSMLSARWKADAARTRSIYTHLKHTRSRTMKWTVQPAKSSANAR